MTRKGMPGLLDVGGAKRRDPAGPAIKTAVSKILAVKAKGKIDVLVANAGTGEFAPLASLTEEHFDKLFDLNVKGTLFTVQRGLTLMNDGGSIILIGSVASVKGTPAFGTYGVRPHVLLRLIA